MGLTAASVTPSWEMVSVPQLSGQRRSWGMMGQPKIQPAGQKQARRSPTQASSFPAKVGESEAPITAHSPVL